MTPKEGLDNCEEMLHSALDHFNKTAWEKVLVALAWLGFSFLLMLNEEREKN